MFALKVVFLSLTVVPIYANPTSDNLNQSPSSTKKLPSNPKQETEVKPAIEIIPIQQKSHEKTVKPHRLSKRFIPSFLIPSKYNNDLEYPFKRSGSTSTRDAWPVDGRYSSLLNGYSGYRLNDRDVIKSYDPEVLNFVLGLSKPKRFFGLLPAKEPRRKDLPPRLGEESAPRFARAFNPNPIENPRPPPVSVTLKDVLKHYKTSRYHTDPLDIAGRRYLAQNFQVDHPININNFKLDVEAEGDFFSTFGSDYSESDNTDYSETIEEKSTEDDQQTTTDDKQQPLSRREEFEKFKTYISLIVSQLKDLNRLEN